MQDNEAEAIAEAVRDAQANADIATKRDLAETKRELKRDFAEAYADVATKRDLAEVKAELKSDIAEVKVDITEIKADIAEVKIYSAETKAELIKWMVSVGVLQTALIGALLIKLVPG
jgi:uncharacterized protein (UPF0128 family)